MRHARGAAAIGLLLAVASCSRDDHPKTYQVTTTFTAAPPPSTLAPPSALAPREPVPSAQDTEGTGAFDETAQATPAPSPAASPPPSASVAATPRPPPVDPDQPILLATHDSLGRCFSSLRAGPNAGPPTLDTRVALTVVDTGRVLRTEVLQSDVDDPEIADCLQRTGNMARFSDTDGGPLRTYTIDVRLVAH